MTINEQALRLGKYLEDKLGWTVFEALSRCPKCGKNTESYNSNFKYCPYCKASLPAENTVQIIKELAKAIEYSKKESKSKNTIYKTSKKRAAKKKCG